MGAYEDGFAAGYALGFENGMFGRGRAPVLPIPGTEADKKSRRAMARQPGAPKRKGKAAKGMAKAMKEANKRLRTKSGKLRKGKTQADVAKLAHKIRRQKYA